MPKRIQRKRTKGWRMPEGAKYVGRPTKWGNPFDWREWLDNAPRDVLWYAHEREKWAREQCVDEFTYQLRHGGLSISVDDVVRELKGRDLACFCATCERCHADVLLELANQPAQQEAQPQSPPPAG